MRGIVLPWKGLPGEAGRIVPFFDNIGAGVRVPSPGPARKEGLIGKLRVPRYRELRKILKQMGFSLQPRRGKGDHEVWKHPDGRMVVLDPGKDPPPLGTFKRILKAAGIPEEMFR